MSSYRETTIFRSARAWMRPSCLVAAVSALALLPAAGQLAITEVMSSASLFDVDLDLHYPDFWELTNFGMTNVDLATYRFSDNAGIDGAETNLFQDLDPIGPGESIIFIRRRTSDIIQSTDDFRAWWGDSNLSNDLRVVPYPRPGFDNVMDAIQLWQVTATSTSLVDRVDFSDARDGYSFSYDPVSGLFESYSFPGEGCVFKAISSDDFGSPGCTTGPVPLSILEEPRDPIVDAGSPAKFCVLARGLPKPRYQWLKNGEPIPGANSNCFDIQQTKPEDAGEYAVELDNGLETIQSRAATLEVNTNATCARIEVPPADLSINPGQTAVFRVEVRGYPLPTIQWQFNGENISGATNNVLYRSNAGFNVAGPYTVRVENALCSTNATAFLAVVPKPNLVITEVMTEPSTNTTVISHNDWWELTNMDTIAVNLRGYHWDDFPCVLGGAEIVATNDLVLQPGESMIFCEGMSREAFIRWWGEENLPCNLKIMTYHGNGFSSFSDCVCLWNAAALESWEKLTSACFVNLREDEFVPRYGVSLWFDPSDPESEFGKPSILNQCGAFRSAEGDDVGSPGWTSCEPRVVCPRITDIRHDSSGVAVSWITQPGRTYELRSLDSLEGSDWTLVRSFLADGNSLTAVDVSAGGVGQRFYRIILLP